MAVYVGSARIDENGKAYGGKAGDQAGKELSTQEYYVHPKGWRVFRAKDREAALKIAEVVDWACANAMIGYDQWNRHTLYVELARYAFERMYTSKNVETDCSALVRVCLAFCGIDVPEAFRTGNMPENLLATGAFVELKGSKYTGQSTYLGRGDILVTKTSGHTVVVLDDGQGYEKDYPSAADGGSSPDKGSLGTRLLKHGSEGTDVKIMQEYLITLGYDLGKWGADGDYGDATELAVMEFQRDADIEADGDYGPVTHTALMEAIDKAAEQPVTGKNVRIQNGNCWVRSAPDTSAARLGVAKNGTVHPYREETAANGWLRIEYEGQDGWVSGKYGKVE